MAQKLVLAIFFISTLEITNSHGPGQQDSHHSYEPEGQRSAYREHYGGRDDHYHATQPEQDMHHSYDVGQRSGYREHHGEKPEQDTHHSYGSYEQGYVEGPSYGRRQPGGNQRRRPNSRSNHKQEKDTHHAYRDDTGHGHGYDEQPGHQGRHGQLGHRDSHMGDQNVHGNSQMRRRHGHKDLHHQDNHGHGHKGKHPGGHGHGDLFGMGSGHHHGSADMLHGHIHHYHHHEDSSGQDGSHEDSSEESEESVESEEETEHKEEFDKESGNVKKMWKFQVGGDRDAYEYKDVDGFVKGFSLDVMQSVCKVAGQDCHWVMDDPDHCWKTEKGGEEHPGIGLLGNWYDACATVYPTPEKLNSFNFTLPYTPTPGMALYCRAEVFDNFVDKDTGKWHFVGQTIGFIEDFTTNKRCLDRQISRLAFGEPFFSTKTYKNKDQLLKAINNKKVDIIVYWDILSQEFSQVGLKKVEPIFACTASGLSMMVPYGSGMLEWWNIAFEEFYLSGEYHKLCNSSATSHGFHGMVDCF